MHTETTVFPPQSQTPDYPDLRKQLNDYASVFYGPHSCLGCGRPDVVKKAFEQGGDSWELPCKRNGLEYKPHHCTHVLVFKKLAGRVLTVLDAAFPPASPQLKAIKDLLKRDFASIITEVRQMEGDTTGESLSSLEQIAQG
jgi:hypothetical protein